MPTSQSKSILKDSYFFPVNSYFFLLFSFYFISEPPTFFLLFHQGRVESLLVPISARIYEAVRLGISLKHQGCTRYIASFTGSSITLATDVFLPDNYRKYGLLRTAQDILDSRMYWDLEQNLPLLCNSCREINLQFNKVLDKACRHKG